MRKYFSSWHGSLSLKIILLCTQQTNTKRGLDNESIRHLYLQWEKRRIHRVYNILYMRIFVQHNPRKIPQSKNKNIPNADNIHTRFIGVWIKPLYMRNKFCSTGKIKNGELDIRESQQQVGWLHSIKIFSTWLLLVTVVISFSTD